MGSTSSSGQFPRGASRQLTRHGGPGFRLVTPGLTSFVLCRWGGERTKVVHAVLIPLLVVLVVLMSRAPVSAAAVASAQPNRITVIGDSILTAVSWNEQPRSILEQGFADIDLQIAVCRRLTGPSCPFENQRPPNLIDLVQALGDGIGSTVVVEVGYNDPEVGFAAAVDQSVRALLAAGVRQVLWVNYHDWVPAYAQYNTILRQVVAHYSQVTIVDWQADSLNRYSWFQSDGIHLVLGGAVALATLIHQSLVDALAPAAPPPIVAHVPKTTVARVGKRFITRLRVTGGTGPFEWRVTGGPLGCGLHLRANGVLAGTPTRPERVAIHLVVSDAFGESAALQMTLTVKPRGAPR